MRDRLAVGVKRQALLLDRDDDLQRSFRHLLGCLGLETGSGIRRALALRRLALDLDRCGVQVRERDGDGSRLEVPCGVGRHRGGDHGCRDARAQQAAPVQSMRCADKPSGDFELHDSQSPNSTRLRLALALRERRQSSKPSAKAWSMRIVRRVLAATFRPREPANGHHWSQRCRWYCHKAEIWRREKMRSHLLAAADSPR